MTAASVLMISRYSFFILFYSRGRARNNNSNNNNKGQDDTAILFLFCAKGIDHRGEARESMATLPSCRQPLLRPVRRLKRNFEEYQLLVSCEAPPRTLLDFVQLFQDEHEEFDENRLIWTCPNAFVGFSRSSKRNRLLRVPSSYQLRLEGRKSEDRYFLHIHSTTHQAENYCLELLLGLSDSFYERMGIKVGNDSNELTREAIEIMLESNPLRTHRFSKTVFSSAASGALATSGTRTKLEFEKCHFLDHGQAFAKAYGSREDVQAGPGHLAFIQTPPPFGIEWLERLLHDADFQLELQRVKLNEDQCRIVSQAGKLHLKMSSTSEFADGGSALFESLANGNGPKGIEFCFRSHRPFGTMEGWTALFDSVRHASNLEVFRLSLWRATSEEDQIRFWQNLAKALLGSTSLKELRLFCTDMSPECYDRWRNLVQVISAHPSLTKIDFALGTFAPKKTRLDHTMAMKELLSVNQNIEQMEFCDNMYDPDTWRAQVLP